MLTGELQLSYHKKKTFLLIYEYSIYHPKAFRQSLSQRENQRSEIRRWEEGKRGNGKKVEREREREISLAESERVTFGSDGLDMKVCAL